MRVSNVYFILLLLSALGIGSCGESEAPESATTEAPLPTTADQSGYVIRKSDLQLQKVQNRNIQHADLISGRVIPAATTTLLAEVQGRPLRGSRPFKAGTIFRQGEVLLQLDSREFSLNLEAQKSAFLSILTGIMPDMKADYPDNFDRWSNYIAQYNFAAPLAPLPPTSSAPEKYFLSANQVYNTYYSIKANEERLRKYVITAPFDGMVTEARIDDGGLVSPGQALGTFISHTRYEVEAAVNLTVVDHLQLGDTILFHSPALPEKVAAIVVRINTVIDAETQNIPVFLTVLGSGVKSGIYLEGQVPQNTFDNATRIASELLLRDRNVLVLENNVIAKKAVQVLESNSDSLVVRGLNTDDLLVLNQFEVPVEGVIIVD